MGARPGMVRFEGNPSVFYVAICKQCDMAIPFDTRKQRSNWAGDHSTIVVDGKAHTIEYAIDVIPDEAKTQERKNNLVAALREKYARSAPTPSGCCSGDRCWRPIHKGESVVSYAGKWYHAACVDDSVYLRLASLTDVMPGLFDSFKPQGVRTWVPGDPTPNDQASITVAFDDPQRPRGIVLNTGDSRIKMPDVSVYDIPKKMNARERRRQRRKGKQWTK